MAPRIERAIKRHGALRSELPLKRLQHWPAGETEVNVEGRNMPRREVFGTVFFAQGSDGDWGVNVVKRFNGWAGVQHLIDRQQAIGEIGADNGDVCFP